MALTNLTLLLCAASLLNLTDAWSITESGSAVKRPGESHRLTCSTTELSFSSNAWSWIRQVPGKGLEWIAYMGTSSIPIYYSQSMQGRFTISRDDSNSQVFLQMSGLRADDSAVYYCANSGSSTGYYFDYWGKGTMVTVTSATSTAPTVFPLMPCSSDSDPMITLACLATGFSPSAVTFSWTQNDTALTDFLQYPSVPQENDLHSGVSQIRIRRQDWSERHPYKCKVEHAAGNREVSFVKPLEIYQIPNLKIMTQEEDQKVTLSCLANNFVPNVYEFKWLQNDQEINSPIQFTTPSKAEKTDNGTRYSVASFLTVSADNLRDDTKLTCKFQLGKGQKLQSANSTYQYRPSDKCFGDSTTEDNKMKIIPPSLEDMLYYRSGKLHCQVKVKDPSGVRSVFWMDESGKSLMNNTDPGADVSGGNYDLYLDITYDEWNGGIKRVCFLDHIDLLAGLQKEYVRKNDAYSQKPPSVFMLTPLKHTRDNKVTLTCFVKDFYPEEIYVTWLVDDKPTGHEFNTTNSVRSNGEYSAYSHLTIPAREWEVPDQVYSCLVYHESLEQNRNIVRSITQHSAEQTTMVNLNMKFPDMCKA